MLTNTSYYIVSEMADDVSIGTLNLTQLNSKITLNSKHDANDLGGFIVGRS